MFTVPWRFHASKARRLHCSLSWIGSASLSEAETKACLGALQHCATPPRLLPLLLLLLQLPMSHARWQQLQLPAGRVPPSWFTASVVLTVIDFINAGAGKLPPLLRSLIQQAYMSSKECMNSAVMSIASRSSWSARNYSKPPPGDLLLVWGYCLHAVCLEIVFRL